MAITRTGSVLSWTDSNNSGNTFAPHPEVPADATLAIISVTGYRNIANFFTGGTLTLGGVGFTGVVGIEDPAHFMGATFWWVNPPTGQQQVVWDWQDTAITDGVLFVACYYKGINTADPVRSSSALSFGSGTRTTATLTAVTGDKIVAFAHTFSGGGERTHTWTNATELADAFSQFSNSDASVAEADPTGNQTVSVISDNSGDGGISAIVLKEAAAGGGGTYTMDFHHYYA